MTLASSLIPLYVHVHMLDELLPQLGVFQRAMRLIRNELHGNALLMMW